MDYIPIFRFGTVEARLLQRDLGNLKIIPLLEITNKSVMQNLCGKIAREFTGEYFVELPLYLMGNRTTKHMQGLMDILKSLTPPTQNTPPLSHQANFYIQNKKWIKIPVASSGDIHSYSDMQATYNAIKPHFDKVAIRILIDEIQLSSQRQAILKLLFSQLRETDVVLIDILRFDSVEQPVLSNLRTVLTMIPPQNKRYILNAFDIHDNRSEVHNYGPLISKHFGMHGFGDFATIIRYEPPGGSPGQRIVRYYIAQNQHKLLHYARNCFADAFADIKQSPHWNNSQSFGHLSYCKGCKYAVTNANEGQTFWKEFRILHYIFSIVNDTLPLSTATKNVQDLDPDGFDNLFKKVNGI